MNGMVVNSWPYVVAAYSVTWVVLMGYTVHLVRIARHQKAMQAELKEKR